ncbi:hypothetical protein PR003_g19726 [Phytophthora rubi]|nr:hypothetical protein PR001_g3063 [Phytophthora rubi]KAE9312584.1 hypothetical protein PR003_g19726 [Phytophthora rubi]
MKAFLSCDSSIVRARTPSRLVDANEFLFIATETYHKSSGTSFGSREHALGDAPCTSLKKPRAASSVLDNFQATVLRPAVLSEPTISQDSYHPPDTPSSTGAAVLDDDSDNDDEAQLQSRLGSLLERMKKRQQGSGS